MFRKTAMISLVAGMLIAALSVAQTPASAPPGSTGLCKDGSYWSGATKKGACTGHKGVKDWYAAAGSAAANTAPAAAAATAAPAVAAPKVSATPAATAAPAAAAPKVSAVPAATAAPGGGPGQVWVNKTSKVYHCPSDPWYGKTKNGAYMSESDAIAQGNHADHGKACK